MHLSDLQFLSCALGRSPDAVQHDDMKPILKLLVLAALCASADAWAKVDSKFERWLGRTTAQVLEAGDRVEVFVRIRRTSAGRELRAA